MILDKPVYIFFFDPVFPGPYIIQQKVGYDGNFDGNNTGYKIWNMDMFSEEIQHSHINSDTTDTNHTELQ
jgi:hypothetical protein